MISHRLRLDRPTAPAARPAERMPLSTDLRGSSNWPLLALVVAWTVGEDAGPRAAG